MTRQPSENASPKVSTPIEQNVYIVGERVKSRGGTMDKLVTFTAAELVALETAAVWFLAELQARTDRADSEVDREMSADQMKHLLDARKKIHEARK